LKKKDDTCIGVIAAARKDERDLQETTHKEKWRLGFSRVNLWGWIKHDERYIGRRNVVRQETERR